METKVVDLKPGDRVDLAKCRYASGDPIAEFEFAVVMEVKIEDDEVIVDYENTGYYYYPIDYSVWVVPKASVEFEVDIPDPNNLKGSWINVATCKSREKAVEWIRRNIGPCDDEGRISFISEIFT